MPSLESEPDKSLIQVHLAQIRTNKSYANDSDAALSHIPIGGIYRNGYVLQIRIS